MLDRREFMRACTGMGLAGTLLPGVLWAQAQAEGAKKITKEMIENAASIADVPISDEYKEMMLENLNDQAKGYEEIYKLHMPNSVEPALIFDPVLSSTKFETEKRPMRISVPTKSWATDAEEFGRAGICKRTSTRGVDAHKKDFIGGADGDVFAAAQEIPRDPQVRGDSDGRARNGTSEKGGCGKYRGPLHGIPWGAKDLLATKGYKTTWGAAGFENQMIDEDATVVQRLDKAGAVLVAKLTLGALAQGDVWFGGVTRNASRSASVRKRWGRFRRLRRDADARDCGRRLGWCLERVRWRFHGAWTSS